MQKNAVNILYDLRCVFVRTYLIVFVSVFSQIEQTK